MPIRILIADDHAIFRSGLRALLERETDFQVVLEAGTGEEALALATRTEVDLLILDISLPGMRGAQVAEAALARRPELPIVILTMHEDRHYLHDLLRIGARGFVLKRSSGTDLSAAIRAAIRGERYVDRALVAAGAPDSGGGPKATGSAGLLTPREVEICRLLAFGHTNAEIADLLCISERTAETHRTNLMKKAGFANRAEIVRYAIEHGLMGID